MEMIILAAGFSTRMEGSNKLLLPYDGKPLLLHSIENAHRYCKAIIVVTGCQRDEIASILPQYVKEVRNLNPERGQDSSIYTALEASDDDVMIVPGDLPSLTQEDFNAVEEALKEHKAVRAFHCGTPAHPVALKKEIVKELLKKRPDKIKTYLASLPIFHLERSVNTIKDIDTPFEYNALISHSE